MRILLTNDDGASAPGLAALEQIAAELSDDVWVVAPETEQSGASRSLTLHAPLRVRQEAERRFVVSGTPTDCVLMGINDLIPKGAPDLVLSGVNRGQNIAEDVTYSGTVAGAMQGMQLGVRAIALSQSYGFIGDGRVRFETAVAHAPDIIRKLLAADWPPSVLANLNFPDRDPEDVQGVDLVRQGFRDQWKIHAEKRTDLRQKDYYWLGFRGKLSTAPEGTDLAAIYAGRIAVTPLHVDMTAHDALAAFKGALDHG
ncbi:MAG: 5'/3'-nucleotidase SurE [Maricaulaceae bacterium]